MIYANFFSPEIISLLFCLHENTIQGEEKDPKNDVMQFLISKILAITESGSACSSDMFEAEMLSITNNLQFVQKYRAAIGRVTTFNDFYREVSKMLKTLRSLRSNKLQQGNLVDFLVRRMYIYFEKLDFKEIVQIYQNFMAYRQGRDVVVSQHQFMLTKSIQQVKFNLQNYSGGDWLSRVQELSKGDHTFKTSYLRGVLKSYEGVSVQSVNEMHRYFDKCLGNLFQQKTEVSVMSNKINHCILSSAFIGLKMGHLQECLQSISQGLRISQNNSDEQSINNCIIYLYKICEQLGKYRQQILLNEHAITHSLNLANILLMVYSCLNYSWFEGRYDCSDPQILLMKNRNINWTDALHFSRKKIYSNFESNCKNIYHSHRNLLIPTFMSKIAVLIHLPQLQSLLLNPYYQRPELMHLQLYQQYKNKSKLDQLISKSRRYLNNRQNRLLMVIVDELQKAKEKAVCPLQIIKIQSFLNEVRFEQGDVMDCYESCEQLIIFCQLYGFGKQQIMRQHVMTVKLLIRNEMYEDGIVKVQRILELSRRQKLKEFVIVCELLKAQLYLHLNIHINEALYTIMDVENSSNLESLSAEAQCLFFDSRALVNRKIYQTICGNINLYEQFQYLKLNEYLSIEEMSKLLLKELKLGQFRDCLVKMGNILLLHPNLVNKQTCDKMRHGLGYCDRILMHFNKLEINQFDEEKLTLRIVEKVRRLCFQ